MSAEDQMEVRLSNARLTVPIYQTKARTQAIADDLAARLRAIEAASPRVDTQAFALQLAFECAVRAAEAERIAKEEEREMGKALERLLASLRALTEATRETGDDDPPPAHEPPSNLTPFRA